MCPLGIRPNLPYKVVLSSDLELPEPERPFFTLRKFSVDEWAEAAEIYDSVGETQQGKDAIEKVLDVIKMGLVGWGNMIDPANGSEIDYNPDNLGSLLSTKEARELMDYVIHQEPTVDELKKSESPLPSSTTNSAESAEQTNA